MFFPDQVDFINCTLRFPAVLVPRKQTKDRAEIASSLWHGWQQSGTGSPDYCWSLFTEWGEKSLKSLGSRFPFICLFARLHKLWGWGIRPPASRGSKVFHLAPLPGLPYPVATVTLWGASVPLSMSQIQLNWARLWSPHASARVLPLLLRALVTLRKLLRLSNSVKKIDSVSIKGFP